MEMTNYQRSYGCGCKKAKTDAWEELKMQGSEHYKTNGIEPVDLYRSGDMFQDFALCSIIKYAFRMRKHGPKKLNRSDLDKIIDYAEKLRAISEQE
jgi:hypothetical protein